MDEARTIVERYTPQAYEIAYRLTGNRADAWDLVQNAMLRVLRSYGTYDPSYKIEAWLYGILRNLYIDRLRLEARRKEQALHPDPDEPERGPGARLVDPEPGPEAQAERSETQARVQRALDTLPGDLRMALILVDLEGCAYDEAARVLECPVSTLGVRVHRGRKLLKERLVKAEAR